MHCYYCQGGVKGLSGERESRKVSPRQTLKGRSVPRRGSGAGACFFCWISVQEVDLFLIYVADLTASWLHTQQSETLGGNNKSYFQKEASPAQLPAYSNSHVPLHANGTSKCSLKQDNKDTLPCLFVNQPVQQRCCYSAGLLTPTSTYRFICGKTRKAGRTVLFKTPSPVMLFLLPVCPRYFRDACRTVSYSWFKPSLLCAEHLKCVLLI